MFTVGKLAKAFKLSRTALLYYDSIGLLSPSARSATQYRHYADSDVERLRHICTLRAAGLRLGEIKRILDLPNSALAHALENRLEELNDEIERLRTQQRFILGLLKNERSRERIRVMNKTTWTSLLEAAGFSEADRSSWHAEFERQSPDKHQQFLEFLCIPDAEIAQIRARARSRVSELSQDSGETRDRSRSTKRTARRTKGRRP
jgi:MerR family transcriptional regulator, thiopeptide resistance regulator